VTVPGTSDVIFVIVLIASVNVVKSIIDDKLPIKVEIIDEILLTWLCFAIFVGYE
jgi:hypothetical protein